MRKFLAVCALAALCVPSAFGQVVRQDGTGSPTTGNKQLGTMFVGGISRADSIARMLTLDSGGNLFIKDQLYNRDNIYSAQIIGPDILVGTAGVDSSAIIDVHQYAYLKAVFFITPLDSAATLSATAISSLAYQCREHVNGQVDSASTAAEYSTNTGGQYITAAVGQDSLDVGQENLASATAVGSGETRLIVDQARVGGGAGLKFTQPTGIARMISYPGGPEHFRYFSMRIRAIGATGTRYKVSVWLLGWS